MNSSYRDRLPNPRNATRFWWVRHALVPSIRDVMYGSLDVDCDTGDRPLFESIARQLPVGAHWVTSPMKRASQTADALVDAGAIELRRESDAAIVEQDFGDFNGLTHAELFARRNDGYLAYWPLPPEQVAPGGESFEALRNRVQGFIDRMCAEHRGGNVVVITHRGPILAALQIALNLPLHNSVSFDIGNVSLTRLTHHADVPEGGPQWKVTDVSWLPGK
ncbi:MAG: histidine phosphatase family protein [Gammaproteobacteria bacterium]|nr:MAG: histidine phosphatase family protein [Gammaproteobacteria bacterium]